MVKKSQTMLAKWYWIILYIIAVSAAWITLAVPYILKTNEVFKIAPSWKNKTSTYECTSYTFVEKCIPCVSKETGLLFLKQNF